MLVQSNLEETNMTSYKIVTDSCCDFTKAMYQELNVAYAPLNLLYKGQNYESFTEADELHDFYDGIRAGEMPSTAAVNPDGWSRIMKPVLQAGQDVLCVTFTSALSTTYQSAVIAAEELKEDFPDRKIIVIDSLCAALGQGLLVMHACKRRDAGMSLEELAAWLEENKHHLAHWVTVDDLNHLKRGGRVSATTAFVGGMLQIKPIIHVDNGGRLDTVSKARGRKAAMELIANKVLQAGEGFDNETICIGHGDCYEDAVALEKLIRSKCPWIKNVHIGYVGGVIGAHTGPGVLVAFFLAQEK